MICEFVKFNVYVRELGPISFWGRSRNLIIPYESPKAYVDFARSWIDTCTESHRACEIVHEPNLPSRLLEVSQINGSPHLKLCETNGAHGSYVALSYCWGCEQPARLTSKKLCEYLDSIEESFLPQTIIDAITVTRLLCIKYLWVDAYCILQDNKEDKLREIRNMTQVYKNSFLTIIAAKAKRASDGFLDSNGSQWLTWDLYVGLPQKDQMIFTLQKIPDVRLEAEPTENRAWTFQEKMLSQRALCFLSQKPFLEWRCDSAHESTAGPIESPFSSDVRLYSPIMPRGGSVAPPLTAHRLCYRWAEIVRKYSNKALTDPDDKLPAIGGIAWEFSNILTTDYYAGMWGSFLHTQLLLWAASGSLDEPNSRAERYRAPSWSWASIDGPVSLCPHPYCSAEPKLTILHCGVTLCDVNDSFGGVASGIITARGLLKSALMRDRLLFDIQTKQKIAFISPDTPLSVKSTLVWCLLVTDESSEDWDVETLSSQSSQDYPDQLRALLGISGSRVRKTAGISTSWYYAGFQRKFLALVRWLRHKVA